jgi:hypothetical protein
MMALVQYNGARAQGDDAIQQGTGIGVQELPAAQGVVAQQLALDAPVAFRDLAPVSLGIGLFQGREALPGGGFGGCLSAFQQVVYPALDGDALYKLQVFAGRGQHLVGEHIDFGQVAGIQAGVAFHPARIITEQAKLLLPLFLDGRRGGKDDGRLSKAADQFQADDGFA